jgi:peptidoglycan hydrolase-like protein with peptidoglycan-binding domain
MMEQKSLRDYMQIVESAQQVQAEDAAQVGNVIGQAGKTAVNTATAAPRAVWDGMKWIYNKGADAVNSAVQGVQNFAGGVAQGFQTGGLDPLHPEQSAQAAQQSYAQAGKPQQGATPSKPAMAPEALKKIQQQLGVAADGIMGPKTQAAIQAFQQKNGLKVDGIAGPKTMAALQAAGQAGTSQTPTANAVATAAPVDYSLSGQGVKLNANNATANTTGGPTNMGTAGTAATAGGYDPKQGQNVSGTVSESTGYDEVERLVSLVHYK